MKCFFNTCSALAISGLMIFATVPATHADTVIGQETDSGGFTGALFPGLPEYNVASDGESSFQPYGIPVDVSDAIQLPDAFNWTQDPGGVWTFQGSDGTVSTWYLPADLSAIGCGVENETTCEPAGHFSSPATWNPGFTGTFVIQDSLGGTSGVIVTFNDANGAHLTFQSDPIPEPASLALLGAGLIGLAAMRRRRHA